MASSPWIKGAGMNNRADGGHGSNAQDVFRASSTTRPRKRLGDGPAWRGLSTLPPRLWLRKWWAECSERSISPLNTRRCESSLASPSACFKRCSTSARTCTSKRRAPARRPITLPGRWKKTRRMPPCAVSIAKMYASDAARTVGNRGIQVHGGMGTGKTIFISITAARNLGNSFRRFDISTVSASRGW